VLKSTLKKPTSAALANPAREQLDTEAPDIGARALALRGDVALALIAVRRESLKGPQTARSAWDHGTILIDAGILAMVGFVPEQIGTPPPGTRRFMSADRGIERGKRLIEGGLRQLHKALELGAPAAVRTDAGRALLALGRRDDAKTLLEDAVKRSPADPENRTVLATVLERLGHFSDAEVHRKTADALWSVTDDQARDSLSDEAIETLIAIAETLLKQGHPEDADVLLGPMAKRSEPNAPLLAIRARTALNRGNPKQARPLLLQALILSTDPQSLRPLLSRVAGSGICPDGEMDVVSAWLDQPNGSGPLMAFARHTADRRMWLLTTQILKHLLDQYPDHVAAWQLLAHATLHTEGKKIALDIAEKAVSLASDDPDVLLVHAKFLEQVGDHEASLSTLQRAADQGAEAQELSLGLAERALANGKHPEAIRILGRILVDTPDDTKALRLYVTALLETHRDADAVVWARRLVDSDGETPIDRQTLSTALLRRGRWQEAVKYRSISSAPTSVQAPIWDGAGRGKQDLCLFHRGTDPMERSILGLALARRLATQDTKLTSVIPEGLEDIKPLLSDHMALLTFGRRETRKIFKTKRFTGAYPLADIMLASAVRGGPIDGFLIGTDPKASVGIDVYVVRGKNNQTQWPPLGDMTKALKPADGAVRVINANDVARTITTLKKATFVITNDPVTAIIAVGMGIPSAVIEDTPLGWWWSANGDRSPWSKQQTLIRKGTWTSPNRLLNKIDAAVKAGGVPRGFGGRPTSSLGKRALDDALDRFRFAWGQISNQAPLSCEMLEGGTRNQIVKVTAPIGTRVLRPGRFPAPRIGFFAKEMSNMSIAAKAGIAPKIFASNPADGAFVIDFVEGEVMRSATLRQENNAIEAGKVLRRLHRLQGFRGEYNIFEKTAREITTVLDDNPDALVLEEESLALIHRAADLLIANDVPPTATHNDPLTRNFIRLDDRMIMIDWECSALADPHWEVAAMAAQAGVRDEARRAFITAYFGRAGHPALCRIWLFEAVCHFYWWIEAKASLLKSGRAKDEKDVASWWRRFRRTVDDPDFSEAMRRARSYRYSPSDDV